jgi:hypothetical protein
MLCDWVSVYEELKGWQAAIGSMLGFIALMVAALWNFRLNRKRDAALRREETVSVAAALYGEVLLLRNEAAETARHVASLAIAIGTDGKYPYKFDQHFLNAHPLSEPIFYKALAAKIGLLDADLVLGITEFHANFQSVRTGLPLLVDVKDRGYSHSVLTVLVPARDAVTKITPTLRKIEHMTAVASPAPEPDLGRVEAMIEMEEIQRGES